MVSFQNKGRIPDAVHDKCDRSVRLNIFTNYFKEGF